CEKNDLDEILGDAKHRPEVRTSFIGQINTKNFRTRSGFFSEVNLFTVPMSADSPASRDRRRSQTAATVQGGCRERKDESAWIGKSRNSSRCIYGFGNLSGFCSRLDWNDLGRCTR